ncbi:MAG: hypothetical protein MJ090_05640 [Clostridia bacterium]|nr:hypothetical protein [Clostridia bacterium]
MKKYENILKRVEEVEYKLGISYAKTNGKLYKGMWILNLLAVIYLAIINAVVILSAVMNMRAGNKPIFSTQTLILIGLFTITEIAGAVFTKKNLKIIGSALGIVSVPYLFFIFYKLCYGFGQGLFNLKTIFYIRHLPSLALIFLASAVMLFISLRERIRTNRDYKRILTNIYDNYKREKTNNGLQVSDEEWEEFITNYSPKNE